MPGAYTLCIQDEKGCENQVDLTVHPAIGFEVDAGDTIFIELGENAELNAVPFPNLPDSVLWTTEGEYVSNQLNSTILPKHTGWYVVTIINSAGCITSDSVLIVVDVYKPIFIPNVISSNQDGINDQVTVNGNHAATGVKLFQIYDRWGGLLWERTNFELNDPSLGWDGTSNGKLVNPAVYTYLAVVDFLDDIPVTYHGTVTVLR
jgi:gliding motility-associated-like protein